MANTSNQGRQQGSEQTRQDQHQSQQQQDTRKTGMSGQEDRDRSREQSEQGIPGRENVSSRETDADMDLNDDRNEGREGRIESERSDRGRQQDK